MSSLIHLARTSLRSYSVVDSEVDPLFPETAERAALGSMLASRESADALRVILCGDDFYSVAHRTIFEAILQIKGQPDRLLLLEKLIRSKSLDKVGGENYIDALISDMPIAGSYRQYAEIVKDRSVRRSKLKDSERLSRDMRDLEKPALNGEWSRHETLDLVGFGKDFSAVTPTHLIYPYLQKGKGHLWDADGGSHKTGALTAISAGLTSGRDVINRIECDPIKVLYLHKGEDLSEEIETVFRANGGESSRIRYAMSPALVFDEKGIELLGNTLADGKFGLLVVDAFFYFLLGLMKGTNDNLPALAVMQPYNAMLAALGVCAVDLRHTTKGKLDKEASELGMGSQQFRNSHRGQLVARYDPQDESENKRVIVTDEKGSLLNPRGKPFAFRRHGLEIQFIQEDVDNPFVSPELEAFQKRDKRGNNSKKRDACSDWLLSTLAGCALRVDAVLERGADAGYSKTMIFEAKKMVALSTRNEPKEAGQEGRPRVWWSVATFDWRQIEQEWGIDPFADEDEKP